MPVRPGMGPCSIEGCDRDLFARGWCTMHYNRWRRDGDPGPVLPTRTRTSREGHCTVEGCDEPIHAHRLCNRHLKRLQTHGDPGPAEALHVQNSGRSCQVDGCPKAARKRGYCGMHYIRWRQTGDPGEAASRYLPPPADGLCSVDGCDYKARSKRLCPMHLSRLYKEGDVGEPARRKAAMGTGRTKTGQGYIMIAVPGHPEARKSHYVLEHRVVMEGILGRYLLPNENVHHMNGIRDDNRPGNLELWVKPQMAGQRVRDLVDWVVETYPAYVRSAIDGHPHLFMTDSGGPDQS